MKRISMTRKETVLVTGATGSIGGAATAALSRRGASAEKLNAKADAVRNASSDVRLDHQDVDLATLAIDFSDMDSALEWT